MNFLQLFVIASVTAYGFNSAATENIESHVSKVLASCGDSASSQANKKVQIAFLRGSPMDAMNAPQAGEDYLNATKNVLTQKGYQVVTQSAHHTSWEKVCESFKSRPDHRVILVGHSYGSSGALKVANCLKKFDIETEALISVSSFDFLAGVDVSTMPSHVKNHLNLSVKDPLIPGYKNHKAENPEVTHLINREAKLSQTAWPHLAAAGKLLPLISLYTTAVIEGQLNRLELPEIVQDKVVNSSLNEFWKCPAVVETSHSNEDEADKASGTAATEDDDEENI